MSGIKNIVFDLGRVLVDFNYDDLFYYFSKHGIFFKSVEDFAARTNLVDYEYGSISSDEFIDKLSELFTHPVNRELLTKKWVQIFDPITQMIEWASDLKNTYGIFILSNTSALHWDYLISEYKLDQLGMGMLASFEVAAMKPEEAIFREAEKRFDLNPETTLFIDDIKKNVEGAISCGWQAIHHTNVEETQKHVNARLTSP